MALIPVDFGKSRSLPHLRLCGRIISLRDTVLTAFWRLAPSLPNFDAQRPAATAIDVYQ
jgi:hypothetical protein